MNMGMLTEVCQEIRNWFDYGMKKYHGPIVIQNNEIIVPDVDLKDGQYFRIIKSVFNDGVHVYPHDESLIDEDFVGELWAMAVPPSVIALVEEISAWQEKYGGIDSALMSPYQSESFGGYSYSKLSGKSNKSGSTDSPIATWQSIFASRLNKWRKI